MSAPLFPENILTFQHPSFELLHHYTRVLSAIRRALTPPQKHWYHISLRVNSTGLTTTPIPYAGAPFEISLDLLTHRVVIRSERGDQWATALRGQPLSEFWRALNDALAAMNIHPHAPKPAYDDVNRSYDAVAVQNFFRALSQVDSLLKIFQTELRGETSPVQFWSHHFDLAMLWFSGRKVPDQDPNDLENADEQMNFGFSPGDASVGEPYFYITAYPMPNGFTNSALPNGARWQTQAWQGAVLPYRILTSSNEPDALLMNFWRTVQKRGEELMRDYKDL